VSSRAAIGAISAVLVELIKTQMSDLNAVHPLFPNEVAVTAQAPDLIELKTDAPPQVNLFLYRVSPNQGWWNEGQPSRAADGTLLCSPPLALNLHYLLTAYGQSDYQAELMLGYAMYLLHQNSVIDFKTLQTALATLPPGFDQLSAPDLAYQPESITITLEPSDTEEIARLWTAISTNYRPTATYVVTVVLINTPTAQQSALPVLSRGPVDTTTHRDRGVVVNPSTTPPLPTLTGVGVPAGQTAAQLGETITLLGHSLTGTNPTATFIHRLLAVPITLPGTATDAQTVTVTLPPPSAAADTTWLAGPYQVTLTVAPPLDNQPRTTNPVTLPLAPTLTLPPSSITRSATGTILMTLQVQPQVDPGQDVWLFLGSIGGPVQPLATASDTLNFELPPVPAGPQWVRVRVDGVETPLVDTSTASPSFVASQTVTVPA
jgi:hypothetical protein